MIKPMKTNLLDYNLIVLRFEYLFCFWET